MVTPFFDAPRRAADGLDSRNEALTRLLAKFCIPDIEYNFRSVSPASSHNRNANAVRSGSCHPGETLDQCIPCHDYRI